MTNRRLLTIVASLLLSTSGCAASPAPCVIAPTNDLKILINPKMCHESEPQPDNDELVLLACTIDNPHMDLQAAGVLMLRSDWERWSGLPAEKPKPTEKKPARTPL